MGDTASLPTGTVTFLFSDIEGSTRLWEQYPEAMHTALARHDALFCRVIQAHNGQVFKTWGDAFCAAFATAPDALAAALAAQRALHTEALGEVGPLRVRMALHTGAVEARGGDYFGPALNRVARLLSAGHGGEVLFSQATADLVRDLLPAGVSLRDLGVHRLRDLTRPEAIFQLVAPDLPADFPPLRSLEAFSHNLPVQLTSFVGREREMTAVKQHLRESRLLTLTGAGGCGKTRLALQVAADLVEQYANGVWLVELAALSDPALVPQAVASALGVREEPGRPLIATLSDYLRPRSLLLVLDNCEHLVQACAELAEALLQSCPNLRILATSREALCIAGEATSPIPTLSLPQAARSSQRDDPLASLSRSEAAQLFIARAGSILPSFTVTPRNAPAVAQVCRQLDGIPLALELAAARVKVLSVEQLAHRLDDRFRLLTGGSRTALPRQQTLRALIDWSYELLSEPERVLLRRLSVFAGGWTLKAAEAVCSDFGFEKAEVLDLLSRLVDKSLVIVEEGIGGESRYRLLETVRQYSLERLREAEEEAAVRRRHAQFFLALVEEAEPELIGGWRVSWLDRLQAEYDNLRAVLAWSRSEGGDLAIGLCLAGALLWFWVTRGYDSEPRTWLAGALAAADRTPPSARARAQTTAAVLAYLQGDPAVARPMLEACVASWRELNEPARLALGLRVAGWAAFEQGDSAAGRHAVEESLELYRQLGDKDGVARALTFLGHAAYSAGDAAAAQRLWEESRALAEEVGDEWLTAWMLLNLGKLAEQRGDEREARQFYERGLLLKWTIKDYRRLPGALESLAGLTCVQGQVERGVRLFAAAAAERESCGGGLLRIQDWAEDQEQRLRAARAALGEERFAAAWAEGLAMTLAGAIADALGERADG